MHLTTQRKPECDTCEHLDTHGNCTAECTIEPALTAIEATVQYVVDGDCCSGCCTDIRKRATEGSRVTQRQANHIIQAVLGCVHGCLWSEGVRFISTDGAELDPTYNADWQ